MSPAHRRVRAAFMALARHEKRLIGGRWIPVTIYPLAGYRGLDTMVKTAAQRRQRAKKVFE